MQIVRLHKEFVRVPRKDVEESARKKDESELVTFWDFASQVMHEHADRKAELEIQFIEEVGTGLGPTMEFFSLLSRELRRKCNKMWVCTDESKVDSVENKDPDSDPSLFVNAASGLFPAAMPQDQLATEVIQKFYVLGVTVAKVLQDNRRIDLPFSAPFIKLLLSYASMKPTQQQPHAYRPRRKTSSSSQDSNGEHKHIAGQKRKCSGTENSASFNDQHLPKIPSVVLHSPDHVNLVDMTFI
ncbi:hypothetical protein Ciccas_010191 [Cichlidogyrus casuarinus]|uniref:E3 ubiquitin-protein ligase n=1 Tax=Cichlidogyrus casuarinus TaxID=1844966 RepID=A0ABD2PUT5_9PLAT